MKTEHIQTNMAAGVWGAALKSRVDLEGYYQALAEANRFTIFAQGGAAKDGGFGWRGATKDNNTYNVELKDFRFNNDPEQCYTLEFGHRYLRFFWGYDRKPVIVTEASEPVQTVGTGLSDLTITGSYVLDTATVFKIVVTTEDDPDEVTVYANGDKVMEGIEIDESVGIITSESTGLTFSFTEQTGHTADDTWEFHVGYPYELATPYESGELADLRITQRADVVYLYHANHPVRKLERLAHDEWRLSVVQAAEARWLGRTESVRWEYWSYATNKAYGYPKTPSALDNWFSAGSGAVKLGDGAHTGTIGWSSMIGWYDFVPSYLTNIDPLMTWVGVKYDGTIYIDEAGDYTFAINGAHGCDFYVDGVMKINWINASSGWHLMNNPNGASIQTDYLAHSAKVTLTAGEHSFQLRTYRTVGTSDIGIALVWKRPGDTAFALIPAAYFVKRSESSGVEPATYQILTGISLPTDGATMDTACDPDTAGAVYEGGGVWDDRFYFHSNSGDPVSPFPLPDEGITVDRCIVDLPNGETFSLEVNGWLYVDETGDYTIGLDSNDASEFTLHQGDPESATLEVSKYGASGGSATFEDGWDLHNSGAVALTAGWYQFRARLVSVGWGYSLGVGWKTPSDSSWNPIPRWNMTPGREEGYPETGCHYEGRHWLFRDITAWGSKTNRPDDFETGSNDSDGMELYLDTRRVDRVQAVEVMKGGILIFSSGGILLMNSGSQGAITPENRRQEEEVARGAAAIAPVRIGNSIFYVGKDKRTIYELRHDERRDSMIADCVTIFAEHYFDEDIVKIVAQEKARLTYEDTRTDVLWALTSGGHLYGMTYDEANNVYAWHEHNSDADVQSIAVTVGPEGEELWAAVKRTEAARGIESLHPELCLDAAVVQADTLAVVATHLASQDVVVRYGDSADDIDGWESMTLDADGLGELDLEDTPDYVETGLSFTATLTTMPLEKKYPNGTTKGAKKRWVEVGVDLQNAGGTLTVERANGGRIKYPLLTKETGLTTEEKTVRMAGYDQQAALTLEASDPMPCSILSVRGKVEVER